MQLNTIPYGRGNTHFELSQSFISTFPVGTVLTLTQFDNWAIDNGLYDEDTIASYDVRILKRSYLRKNINSGGTCSYLSDINQEGFIVSVKDAGKSYEVRRSSNAFNREARRLPKKINSLVQTKQSQLHALRQSADYDQLPAKTQLMVDMMENSIHKFAARLNYECKEMANDYAVVAAAVANHRIDGPRVQLVSPQDDFDLDSEL